MCVCVFNVWLWVMYSYFKAEILCIMLILYYRVWMMCWAVKWRIMLSLYWMVGILMDTCQIKQTVTPLLVSVLTLLITLMEDYRACKYKDHMLLWVYIYILQYSVSWWGIVQNILSLCIHVCVCVHVILPHLLVWWHCFSHAQSLCH